MKTLTLKIPDNKYAQFLKMLESLELPLKNISMEEDEPTKEHILEGIKEAVEEVNLIKAGKKKGVLLKDFLNEL